MPIALIESLDREGRGVAHVGGKAVFVDSAVPGERVEYSAYRKKPAWEAAQIVRIEKESAARASPRCAFFGTCGGCSMQHVEERAQVAAKQRVLEDALWHIARLRPETLLRPLYGLFWGYRHRARMSVRWVPKKGGSLVGFRERKSRYVTDMTSCEVLPPRISDLLRPLRTLVDSLEMQGRLPQIEVAVGEESVVLVFRVLVPPGAGDAERLRQFAVRHGVQLWLQPEGPDSARPFWPPDPPDLYYTLPEYGLRIAFGPPDFTQVNHAVNRLLVGRARIQKRKRPAHQQPVHRVVDLGEIGRAERDAKPVFGQRVVQIRRIGRPEWASGVRPFGLEPQLHAVPNGKLPEALGVASPGEDQNPEHQHDRLLAHCNLDLGQSPLHLERIDQRAQGS